MNQKLVVLAEYPDAISAHSVRILLEASGMQAFVTGDTPNEHGGDCVLVHVLASDHELATSIVQEVPAASEVLIPEWRCQCGETVDEGFHVCWSCGFELSQ